MTKTIKKSFIVLLMLVASLFFAFAVGTGFNSASAAEDKESIFINDVEAFKTKADADENGVLSADEIRDVMGTDADTQFFAMYSFMTNDYDDSYTSSEFLAAKELYVKILGQYDKNGAVQLYSSLVTNIRKIYTQIGASYKNNSDVVSARTDANKFNGEGFEKDLAFLKNSDLPKTESGDFEDLVKAEAKMIAWKANIDDAIKAIKEIQVYVESVNANGTVDVYDSTVDPAGYRAANAYNVLWASKNSVEEARRCANIVDGQGDLMYISGEATAFEGKDHYLVLTNAEKAISELKKQITDVETAIDTAAKSYKKGEVCYTIYESLIKPANDKYNALDGVDYNKDGVDDNLNNLKAGVNSDKYTSLTTMLSEYTTVKNAIVNVNSLIDTIGDVKYDKDSKSKIKAARDAFDALPNDVKTNDNTEDQTKFCVEKYPVLLNAEKAWADYVQAVNDLIESIKGLRAIEESEPEKIYGAFRETQVLYNSLKDKTNQLKGDSENEIVGVESATLPNGGFKPDNYASNVTNCKEAYEYYQYLGNAITTATKDIKKNITSLVGYFDGKVRFNSEFNTTYNDIVSAIAGLPKKDGALDPRYKGAIDNYSEFEAIATKYEELLGLAKAWADSIEINVNVNTFDLVDESVVKFNAIITAYVQNAESGEYDEATLRSDLGTFNVTYSDKLYSAHYKAFVDSVNKKAEIIGKLDALKNAIKALARPETVADATANEEYAVAVAKAKALYEGLNVYDATGENYISTAKYFQITENSVEEEDITYKAAYELYVQALKNVDANEVEEKIAKIVAESATGNLIADARTAYNKFLADYKVAEEDDEVVRNKAVLKSVEEKVQDFVRRINALLDGAAYDGSSVAADKIVTGAITSKELLIAGIYKVSETETTDLLKIYAGMSDVEKAYVSGDNNVKNANDLLNKIVSIATVSLADASGNKTYGTKITYIDNILDEFIRQYKGGTLTTNSYDELNKFVAALTESQQGLLKNLPDFQQIQRDKAVADELKEAIDKLADEVKDGKITKENVIEYYIINSIYENLNESQKALLGKVGTELTATKKLAEIKAKIEAADNKVIDVVKAIDDAKTELQGNIDTINTKISELEAAKATLTTDVAANKTAIASINTTIAELKAAKATLEGKVSALESDVAAIKTDIANITKDGGTIDSKVAAAKDVLEKANKKLEQDYKDADDVLQKAIDAANAAIKAEVEAREAAIKAETEAREAETKKLHNAIVTISIIFSIVLVALVACVVVLFLKKRA